MNLHNLEKKLHNFVIFMILVKALSTEWLPW